MSRYTRAQWGAQHRAGFGDRSANYPLGEAWLHHSVTAHLSASATFAQEAAQMRVLEQIGQNRFNGGISYNFVIFPSGRAYHGLGASRIGAHTANRNSISLSIVFAGNYETNTPTAAALGAAAQLLKDLRAQGILRQARLNGGHGDAPGNSTACPGRHLRSRISTINSQAAGNVSPAATPAPASAPAPKPAPKPAPRPHPSERLTRWPDRALPVQDFPLGTFWLRLGDSGRVVPDEYRHALILALHGAGYSLPERTEQGAWAQIRRWLRGQHGFKTPTDRRSVGRDFQRYLQRQGLYRGAIDGVLGPQSIWAITTWLNRIRSAYN